MINGGFFVVEPEVLDKIVGDSTTWENEPLAGLIDQDQLAVYRHQGYWQNMDTLRDKMVLQELWDRGDPPWCVWNKQPSPSTHANAVLAHT
jgi:glucose-1-phosphate cytidylyltransferase